MAIIHASFISATGILVLAVYLVYPFRKLRGIPGPSWARVTNLPRVGWVRTGRSHEIHQNQHRKYGDVVRFGPNMVSAADPAYIAIIYPMRPGFPKVRVGFYFNNVASNYPTPSVGPRSMKPSH
jgi:hypothetical protein